ncbi:hemerythrin domain-containing protein [Massilia yuzhufengensis]|uniref:Hemerythrin HHE cation binding domain-containing protein n=1 Tax=Massilia yuzhufengensis TaxID=1164594 RepID=A0A1I1EYK0_9BURK|nr:hemerythrin domain-containing protein [Massilia yuzhufengensis]SFB91806.1 Hemerythrin HHE cation binding domain-containing protein [Massilia yuzhufengensis]
MHPHAPPEPPAGILAQLRADHAHVRALFHQFAMLDREEEEQRERVVDDLCDDMALHAALEDELFYPALRGVVDDSLLEDAALEHDSTRELILQLESLFPGDDYFDIAVAVLADEFEQHVAFEETVLFPALAGAGVDQLGLGLRLHARRAQLQSDLASAPPAIDGTEPRDLLRGATRALRERRSRPRPR